MPNRHRVVILGGGFGGLYAAQALKHAPVEVTLVDRRNYHLFQPLLYQVATGSLSPGEIAAPIRGVLNKQKNTQVLLGEAVSIDPALKRVKLLDGVEIEYDSLLVATGSHSSYFGKDEWREWAPSLKTIEEATAIRHKILYAFEAAERLHENAEERRAWLTFVIVGAGPTGVELAGALGDIANETLKDDFRSIKPEEARILVVDGSPRALPSYPEDLSGKAEAALIKLGVRIRNGLKVTKVDGNGVTFEAQQNGETVSGYIPARTVIWAAGVTTTEFGKALAKSTNAETDRQGRIKVLPDLTIPGFPDIFVVGDQALSMGKDSKPLPGVAQVAMQEGSYAAKAIANRARGVRNTKPFHYFNKGDLAVIGRASAVADVFGFHLWGFPAWLIWLFIHLMYIVEFRSRIIVFIEWAFLYLTSNRGARLITGHTASDALGGTAPMKNPIEE
jgi:NADH:ubiquinone reductase (H+-translocating)